MEHNGSNQDMAFATLCRMGCGFYGNSAFDGMCSKCYKDMMKRRQQNTSPTQTTVTSGRMSPPVSATASAIADVITSSVETVATSCNTVTTSGSNGISTTSNGTADSTSAVTTTPSINSATPTVPTASTQDKTQLDKEDEGATGGEADVSTDSKDKDSSDKDKKPKKNRCHTCKKKVGLTGFQCRCGGLYCGLHRYSDKHNCTFNYKEMAQEQIRKNNPVVVGQKIQKI